MNAVIRGRCTLFALVTGENDGAATERDSQLTPAPRPSTKTRYYPVTKVALRKMLQYWDGPRRVSPSIRSLQAISLTLLRYDTVESKLP